jgi:phosphoenolpyruvate phosphomutase
MSAKPNLATSNESPALRRTTLLKNMLHSSELEFIMEAHNGISAKIVEEAGFKGIWASGLSVSAALGVRDNNEASWTQVLEVLEFMADASSLPILVDGDTGYGNFNNMRRVVRKLEQRGLAGICIEDKLFPKTNSFLGEGQPLADMDEHCGKIKAGKDSQTDSDFCVVARLEALISGWGVEEALRRAEAYHNAGADAVLIHSKESTADEIFEFCKEWNNKCPVVIVPTKYYTTPTDDFRKHGVSLTIWANHNIRASMTAMREISQTIQREETLLNVDPGIIKVKEIFDITGNEELEEAERRYLPDTKDEPHAIVLAASRGKELGELTEDRPKAMLDLRGRPLLGRLASVFRDEGIRDITVVRGYKKDTVNLPSINFVDNDVYAKTGEAASLACASEKVQGTCIVAYGDTLFRHYILDRLMGTDGDIVLAVDALWQEHNNADRKQHRDLAACSKPFSPGFTDDELVELTAIGDSLEGDTVNGEWLGLAKFSSKGSDIVRDKMSAMGKAGELQKSGMSDLFQALMADGHKISVLYVTGHWLDVNDEHDLQKARDFL